jgi:polysaccharide biosynthesis protein PslH
VTVPPRTKAAEAKRTLAARWKGEPYAMFGRHARPEVLDAFALHLKDFSPDVVWLDHIDSLLFEPLTQLPTVIDLHNVYSLILDRLAVEATHPLKRWFFRGEARRMRAMERRAAGRCTAVLAVSDAEAAMYRGLGATSVRTVPNGVDCGAFAGLPTGRPTTPAVILFLGTLSWGPNVTAAVALAQDIFPAVQRRLPDAKLLLVGKDPAPEVAALSTRPGVTVAGSVPSITPYLEQATLLAVPLDSGGGTRLKILEAFAAGLPVVSTAVGAEGIAATPGTHVIIAERPAMADAIVAAVADAGRLTTQAAAARQLVTDHYDWSSIGVQCVDVVRTLHAADAR